jgi:hypothetical protein
MEKRVDGRGIRKKYKSL